jgi:SAM-dependent methyltransferase
MPADRLTTRLRRRLRRPRTTNRAELPPEQAWESALDGEVAFWRKYLETKGAGWAGYAERTDPALPLQPEITRLIRVHHGSPVRVLDVGAGPLTWVGRTSDDWDLEVVAVDALGDHYADLLAEAGVVPPVVTQTCESERLTEKFGAGTFDVVTARNTLDHSYDPVRAIGQMLDVAKAGAPLLLVHHRNTAEDESYRGMHQWNFEAADDSLVVWRPGTRTDIARVLEDRCRVETHWLDGRWEHVVLRKHL